MTRRTLAPVIVGLVLASAPADAQETESSIRTGFLVSGGGVAQFTSDGGALVPGVGATAGVEILTAWGLKLRAEGGLSRFIGGRTRGPACPGIGCAPPETPPMLASGAADLLIRPFPASRRLYAFGGIGFYASLGAESRYYNRSEGINGGIGWALRDWDEGSAVEVWSHRMEDDVGLMTGFVSVVMTYRF